MTVVYVLIALLVFGFLIFSHELGHFLCARLFRVKILEFSIGMGPKIFSRVAKKSSIRYSVRALPVGGYVSMAGENESSDDENALCNKKKWQRFLIFLAGPAVNLIFGFLCMILVTCITVFPVFTGADEAALLPTNVISVFKDDAISNSGDNPLMENDRIVKVGSANVHTAYEVSYEIMMQGDEPITLTVVRNSEKIRLENVRFPQEISDGVIFGVMDFKIYGEEANFGNILK